MIVTRENTEIRTQSHLMDAEGTADTKPTKSEIEFLLSKEGYSTKDIKIWFDNMQGFWRWNCTIEPSL